MHPVCYYRTLSDVRGRYFLEWDWLAVVYALSKESFHAIAGTNNPAHILDMKAGELLSRGGPGGGQVKSLALSWKKRQSDLQGMA
jgi:hypothetical protein